MSAPFVPALDTFTGGQMTDLPPFTGTSFDGTELFEIVAPGNPAQAVNYSITSERLAALLVLGGQVIISQGQNNSPSDPYLVPATMGRVYVNKTVAEPTYVQLQRAALYTSDPLVADIAGTVDASGNGIFVTFTGSETADKLSPAAVTISTPFGGYFFRPVTSLDTWHLGTG